MDYVGNTGSLIDWDKITSSLDSKQGLVIGHADEAFKDVERTPNEDAQIKMLIEAGYNDMDSIEWANFFSGQDYDTNIDKVFGDIVNADCMVSWISRIRPGKCVPYHWDFNDEYTEQIEANRPNVVRYIAHICDPSFGQVFWCEDKCNWNEEKGAIYKWKDFESYHGGSNFGLRKKYLYNFLAVRRS